MPVLESPRFLDDWRDQLRRELKRAGFVDAYATDENDLRPIEQVYFQAMMRRIEPRPRRVHEARSFKPRGAIRDKYYALRHKIRQGEDLQPHQSSRILSARASDEYLANWGIHHLHLGQFRLENGLVERTASILLCIFGQDDAYVIAIETGERGHGSPWREKRHLDTVVENWPHLFREFEMTSVIGDAADARLRAVSDSVAGARVEAPPNDVAACDAPNDVAACDASNDVAFRGGEPSPVVLANGKAYLPWGGGITADGASARSVLLAGQWRDRVQAAETAAIAQFDRFVDAAAESGIHLSARVVLQLHAAHRLFARIDGTRFGWCLEPAEPAQIVDLRQRKSRTA